MKTTGNTQFNPTPKKIGISCEKDLKIGVYAIAAGEPNEFIDRWLNSMKGADYIWVLVTKLNDPNYAYFKEKQKLDEFKDKLFVEEKEIKPWRFDVARNESYKIVDKYCDGLICTDIDEVLIEDFWDDFKKRFSSTRDSKEFIIVMRGDTTAKLDNQRPVFGTTKRCTRWAAIVGITPFTNVFGAPKRKSMVGKVSISWTTERFICTIIPINLRAENRILTF